MKVDCRKQQTRALTEPTPRCNQAASPGLFQRCCNLGCKVRLGAAQPLSDLHTAQHASGTRTEPHLGRVW